MARHYSTREFFRQVPTNALLKRYFDAKDVLTGFWHAATVECAQAAINSGVTRLPADSREIHKAGYKPSTIRHPVHAGTAPCPPSECGIFAHGFARAWCDDCGHDYFVAYSCKGRGVCPSCNTRRMVETAAHLTDHVFPRMPVRQPSDHWTSRNRPLAVVDLRCGLDPRKYRVAVGYGSTGASQLSPMLTIKIEHQVWRKFWTRIAALCKDPSYEKLCIGMRGNALVLR